MRSNPQPDQSVALSATENKQQSITTIICEQLREKRKTNETTTTLTLLITGSASTPVQIVKGIVMERTYIETIHKEVDVSIPRQVVHAHAHGAK